MKILIVDDSETVRIQLRKDLESKGYQVLEANDGFHGLEVASKETGIKLIICDINMPRMDGISMCKKVRDTPELKTIPIIIMSTESTPEMKAKGKEVGVLAWIIKPYVAAKLLAVLAMILK